MDIRIVWRGFPLHPKVPANGLRLEDYFSGKIDNIEKMITSMKKTAAGLGLPFGDMRHIYNTRLAQELAVWADEKGRGAAFHHAVFAAYFVENNNIGDPDVLTALATSVGLDRRMARAVMAERQYQKQVDADWKAAAEKSVQAVPTFFAGSYRLVGTQPYEKLKHLVGKSKTTAQASSRIAT